MLCLKNHCSNFYFEIYSLRLICHSDEGFTYQHELGLNKFMPAEGASRCAYAHNFGANSTSSRGKFPIFFPDERQNYKIDPGTGPYLPVWQTSPVLKKNWANRNLFRSSAIASEAKRCLDSGEVIIGGFDMAPPGGIDHPHYVTSFYASILSVTAEKEKVYNGDPMSNFYLPIFNSFDVNRTSVAVLMATVNWAGFFRGILPPNIRGVTVIIENSCQGAYTYEIEGEVVTPVGPGDLHNPRFGYLGVSSRFNEFVKIEDGTRSGLPLNQEGCKYSIRVYPSQQFWDDYNTTTPNVITFVVAVIFIFTVLMFLVYDRLVERRQRLILRKATQTSAIVSSLFPANVRERLMEASNHDINSFMPPNRRLKSYLQSGGSAEEALGMGAPIADLVPHSTVLFADISGFTAWSSTRDPAQVFILLQSVYQVCSLAQISADKCTAAQMSLTTNSFY